MAKLSSDGLHVTPTPPPPTAALLLLLPLAVVGAELALLSLVLSCVMGE